MSDRPTGDVDGSDDAPDADGLTPAAAFALLGDPTRLAILRAIWEAPSDVVPFSDLRDRVGVADPGRFNYHIGKLRDHFVRRVDGGYELRQAGLDVVRAVLAGVINEAPVREPTRIGAACPDCGGELLVRYDGHGTVACEACETVWMHNEFPPAGLVGREGAVLARALDRWTRYRSLLAMDGVCPSCASATTRSLDDTDRGLFVDRRCTHCEHVSRAPLWALVLDHPEVASFLHDHGVTADDRPFWELAAIPVESVLENERYRLQFSLDDECLHVVLDGDFQVTEATRTH